MQKEYKHFYQMIAKHNPLPSNCLPFSSKNKHLRNLNKLLQINQSIADVVSTQRNVVKICKPEFQIINLEENLLSNRSSSKRIHNNIPHRSQRESKSMNLKPIDKVRQKCKTLQQKANTSIIPRRKDFYDNTIEKYMQTKYDDDELIDKYLTNRQKFIKQACQEIKKQLKDEQRLHRSLERDRSKRQKSHLPKIQQFSAHHLKKSEQKVNNGAYIQEINQIRRSQELQNKNRNRNIKIFKKKMYSLQNKLAQLRSDMAY